MIVPVHNAEAYIGQRVQSLISQTYQDWEALLIDDGSTVHSLEVCEALHRTESRIRDSEYREGSVKYAVRTLICLMRDFNSKKTNQRHRDNISEITFQSVGFHLCGRG